jgi:competence protein ComEA
VEQSSTPWRVFDAPAEGSRGTGNAATRSGGKAGARGGHRDPSLAGIGNQWLAIAGVAGALVIGAIAVVVAMSGTDGAAADGPPVQGAASATAGDSSGVAGELVIDVTGAVVTPGVYHLPVGSRVGDAIEAAGGFGPRVDVAAVGARLNLAAPLSDGAQVHIPSRDEATAGSGGAGGSSGGGSGADLVNLNTATQAELEGLPGIGPVTAGKIIESRAGAPFKTVDELRDRGLVGEKTFGKLKPLITAG